MKMKIAISSQGEHWDSMVDPRFGRTAYFIVVEVDSGNWSAHDNTMNVNAAHGAGIQAARNVAKWGATVVVTGHIGPKAFDALRGAAIDVYLGASGSIKEAYEAFKAGRLKKADAADGL